MLAYFIATAPLDTVLDASDFAMGEASRKQVNGNWHPWSSYSNLLSPAQQKYSAVNFRGIFRCRTFSTYAWSSEFYNFYYHQPLTFALRLKANKRLPRQTRQLNFIDQFSTDIQHTMDWKMMWPKPFQGWILSLKSLVVNLELTAKLQATDITLQQAKSSELKPLPVSDTAIELQCGIFTSHIRPFKPVDMQNIMLYKLHELSHNGVKTIQKLVSERYV